MKVSEAVSKYSDLTECRHCGTTFVREPSQEARGPESREESRLEFCCSGCEFVFGLLNKNGMQTFYELRDQNPPVCPIPVQPSKETYDYCDDSTFIAKMSPDGRKIQFYLEGLNCTACLWLLEKLPEICTDADSARVNMSNSTIEVARKEQGSFAAIARTLNRLGYRPHPLDNTDTANEFRRNENRRDLIRIGLAAAATGNIMILAVSLYGGADGALASQFRWLTALLATPVLSYCAWPFYKSAWAGVRSRHLNIDVPIVAALMAGIVMSAWGLISNTETVYFDSLSMLVLLLLSSRFWLKRIQQNHLDTSNLENLLLMGTVSRVSENGQLEKISSLSIRPGDVIEVAGDLSIPADGTVVKGHGLIQTAVLTGEAAPLRVSEGSAVEAGSRNYSGEWLMRVTKPASESRIAKILKDTETSARNKPALVQFADRVGQWFITTVFALALGIALYFVMDDPAEGMSRALALIIVTCPCVFGMAIPLSMSLAIRSAAKQGMVIKNADVIERLKNINSLYMDKTGTVTKGDLSVLKVEISESFSDHLPALLALEEGQNHPIARAILAHFKSSQVPKVKATEVSLLKTGGIEGKINGVTYSLLPLGISSYAAERSLQLKSEFGFYCGTKFIARIEIGDVLKPEAFAFVNWAREEGLKTFLISGDKESVVSSIATQLGFDMNQSFGSMTPEMKAQKLAAAGATAAMVGDGANDAAALASAAVGIAVQGSMDVSLRAADVYLTKGDLSSISALFEIAGKTRAAISRNLIFSATFNLIAGTLAVMGMMTPLWAAVLMPLSSLTVLASALATGKSFSSERNMKKNRTLKNQTQTQTQIQYPTTAEGVRL